jgi:TonB family protein
MKILTPITSGLDLAVSATAAIAIHAVVMIFGAGYLLERPPAPVLKTSDRSESIAVLPRTQEPLKEKEKVREERVKKEPITQEEAPDARRNVRKPIAERSTERSLVPAKSRIERERLEPRREKVPVVKREELRRPEEKLLKEFEEEGHANVAISRNPKPVLERGWRPVYPEEAKRRNWEGRVEVMLTISPRGRVLEAKLHNSSGYSILDKSMVDQVKSITFQPARSKAGVPVEWRGTWGWNFDLENPDSFF